MIINTKKRAWVVTSINSEDSGLKLWVWMDSENKYCWEISNGPSIIAEGFSITCEGAMATAESVVEIELANLQKKEKNNGS